MHTGEKLKVALAMKQMKGKDLAKELGKSEQQVSNWITSGRITTDTIEIMCSKLDMKLSEFFAIGE